MEIDAMLVRCGDEGWELIGFSEQTKNTGDVVRTFVFKRPKASDIEQGVADFINQASTR